jgi:hypothetical protein
MTVFLHDLAVLLSDDRMGMAECRDSYRAGTRHASYDENNGG